MAPAAEDDADTLRDWDGDWRIRWPGRFFQRI
jgi:hypothetical protein